MTTGRRLRRLVHDVGAILREVPRRRLLDVEDAVEAGRRRLAHAAQEVEQIGDVRAALVEVEEVLPVRHAAAGQRAGDDAIDADDALEVGVEVAAIELDLEARQAVARNPLLERVRQPIVDPRARTSAASSGSLAPTEWNTGVVARGADGT